jgi:hypothetical protein
VVETSVLVAAMSAITSGRGADAEQAASASGKAANTHIFMGKSAQRASAQRRSVEVLQNDLTYKAHCSKARRVVSDIRKLGRAAHEVAARIAACVVFMTKVGRMS